MAILFVHDQDMDLVIFSLTGNFNLNKLIDAAMAGTIFSASFEIVDLRRCNLNTMRSMDLARFARYLRSAMNAGRLIRGKTAILTHGEGPLRYNPAHRLFHSFSIFSQENKLPRDFKLFTDVNEALGWFGIRQIINKHTRTLNMNTDHALLPAKDT